MPYGGTTSCPERGLELTSRPHYEFPVRESVEASRKLHRTFFAFANHRRPPPPPAEAEINGFNYRRSLRIIGDRTRIARFKGARPNQLDHDASVSWLLDYNSTTYP